MSHDPSLRESSLNNSAEIPTASEAPGVGGHTALPWSVFAPSVECPGIESEDGVSIVVFAHCLAPNEEAGVQGRTPEEARANAAFIVRACNSHDALVSALRDLVEIDRRDNLTDPDQCATDAWREEAMANARAALLSARGVQ